MSDSRHVHPMTGERAATASNGWGGAETNGLGKRVRRGLAWSAVNNIVVS
jgi:hypothetical protein